MRVVVTGFGPFPGAPFNPSAALATALTRRRRPAFADLDRAVHIFATTYASVDRDLPKLLARKPDLVLMFGLAGRRRYVSIETRARNAASVLFPDAGGHRPQHGVIARGGAAARRGNTPFAALAGITRSAKVPAVARRRALPMQLPLLARPGTRRRGQCQTAGAIRPHSADRQQAAAQKRSETAADFGAAPRDGRGVADRAYSGKPPLIVNAETLSSAA